MANIVQRQITYDDIGPKKFKWNQLKAWVQENNLGDRVVETIARNGHGAFEWEELFQKTRIMPYIRVAVAEVLMSALPQDHEFYQTLNK